MRKRISLITVALLLIAWSATAGIPRTEAQRAIDAICAREPLRSALVGVLAVGADGDTLVSVRPDIKLVPASNVKLLTTGMALHKLGPEFRFETRLAYSGSIVDGKLKGDLYILGGGDPTTGSRADCATPVNDTFAAWMKMLRDAGITCIEGRVIGDPRFFSEATSQNLGWTLDDLGANYGAGPLGLNFFENAQLFYISPASSVGAAPNVSPRYPDTPWMKYAVHAVTGKARTANTLYYVSTVFGPFGQVAGSFPIDRRGYTLECHNAFGAYTCASYFHTFLQAHGIVVKEGFGDVNRSGEVRTDLHFEDVRGRAPVVDSLSVLGSTWSAPLSEIVTETNCQSNNFFAETLLRMLAKQAGRPTDHEECQDVAETVLHAMGLRTDNTCQQFDGSGLSRKNYVAPAFFVRFLRKMTTLPVWDAYLASLPVPGKEGTLEYSFRDAPQEFKDRIHMKSGSMNGVRCYSGYIFPADGDASRAITFSLMLNNCTASSYVVSPILEEILGAIAAEN
ncbi:MAG: D-alanyl-D-alanine carboxypeptidase/D-alanyl-D-alanine-endopeptidase [Bacteroidales bacterium]|nr:D-alanyl-D-alanine carboxypeptidase/D-alanyl-D-alanine-endopeptidase [Bacteroidales bacterium]